MSPNASVPSRIRLATGSDTRDCLAIYRPVVEETATSFESEIPSLSTFTARIDHTVERYPWLVMETPDGIAGYAYACQHREREAYKWSVEASAYVAPAFQRRGMARRLYACLFECLQKQHFHNVYAGITLPNDASVAFHEASGFVHIGTYRKVGYKLDKWHDVGWWALRIKDDATPIDPAPMNTCRPAIIDIIARHNTPRTPEGGDEVMD